MSTDENKKILKKDDVELLLKELSKNIRKFNGKIPPTEIIIVGGASILLNYSFRNTTQDIDMLNNDFSRIKTAINHVTDKFDLSNNWINSDFKHTQSYTPKLRECAEYYKTFSNCVEVYTIKDEYLIAMKLVAARTYKNDFSDIAGILLEKGNNLSYQQVDNAMKKLYNGWDNAPEKAKEVIKSLCVMTLEELEDTYKEFITRERGNRKLVLQQQEEEADIEIE